MKNSLVVLIALALGGCVAESLEGSRCNPNGTCGEGYWCHRGENTCKSGEAPIPEAVRLTTTTPASPAKETSFTVRGVAPVDTTVRIQSTPDCTGPVASESTAAQFNATGFSTSVPANTTNSFSATATNAAGYTSACSTPIVFTSDNLAPAKPVLSGSNPPSPGSTTQPALTGTAEVGSTVRLFRGNSCGALTESISSGPQSAFAGAGIQVDADLNTSTVYTAIAVDAAGNSSDCSSPFTFVSDLIAPTAAAMITGSSPVGTARTTTVILTGTVPETPGVVRVHAGDCDGPLLGAGSAADFSSGSGVAATVAENSTTTFVVRFTDLAGNLAPCSATGPTFYADFEAAAPTTLGTVGAARDMTPLITGVTAETGGTVEIFVGDCSGTAVSSGSQATFVAGGLPGGTVTGMNSTTSFVARYTDGFGNVSPCSAPVSYLADFPPLLSSTPASPNASRRPRIQGTIEAGLTVDVFQSADCTGTLLGSFDSATLPTGTAQQFVNPEASTRYSARSYNGTAPSSCAVYDYVASCNASGIPREVCTSGCTFNFLGSWPFPPDDVFPNGMVACLGAVTWPSRLDVCRPGSGAATAAQWNSGRGSVEPRQHYWTNDNLTWAGSGSGSCGAYDNGTGSPCPNEPMRVCAPTNTDLAGNQCNWINCGYNSSSSTSGGVVSNNAYLGGCSGNTTAGTLCRRTASGCADGFTEQTFGNFMHGCGGAVSWANRANLCAAGCRVCKASDWVKARGTTAGPSMNYWTDDFLNYGGGSTDCGAYDDGQGSTCLNGNPMRVCAGTGLDGFNNKCTWANCGYNGVRTAVGTSNFGGCDADPTAGTLCCCPG